ncbi:MAG: hypothetical protein NTY88_05620 [Bacteroidetes bacterium]|nr:hypothetical protein [Bacteroidota bacterium]
MKNRILLLVAVLALPLFNWANNVQCSVTNYNNTTGVLSVSFSSDNSWYMNAAGGTFADGILLFIKYKDNLDPNWRTASIAVGSGFGSPDGGVGNFGYSYFTQSGFIPPAAAAYDKVIISRETINTGTGTISGTADFNMYVPGAVNPSFKVFALEMVFVPTGAFSVGDGNTGTTTLHAGGGGNNPYVVSSNNAITVGSNVGNLNNGVGGGTVSAAFPKGYSSYWMMKYELSQELYVAYLNCLTRTQQDAAIHPSINLSVGSTAVANTYVMSNSTSPLYNQGIRTMSTTIPVSGPLIFICDLSGDYAGSGLDDAQNNAVRVNTPGAVLQFLDWAGMRPMSGFEYEKACRGTATPVLNEYAWGSTDAFTPTTTTTGNANENYTPVSDGPLVTTTAIRNGVFATSTSTRKQSGGSYYGIMELSNSLPELNAGYGFELGTTAFTSALGDGNITNGLPATFPTKLKVQSQTATNNRVSYYTATTSTLTTVAPCAIRGVIQ